MIKRKFAIDWSDKVKKINEQNQGNNFKDERIYYPQIKEDGTAQAIIRFLPSKDTDVPFVRLYNHGFRGVGGWFIENCPTTKGKECPVCKANTAIWETDEDTARPRSRKLSYYSNILVVKDPQNPQNEGKVFIFRYGKKIHEKIMEKMSPKKDSIIEPVMIHDYYEGANFNLIIKTIKVNNKKLPNYDSCSFANQSSLGNDTEIEKIVEKLYDLSGFIDDKQFKSYEELESKFEKVIGSSNEKSTETKKTSPVEKTEKTKEGEKENNNETSEVEVQEGGDDEEAFFKELQEEGN